MSNLRPPLPPPLSHDGIRFVSGGTHPGEISRETLSRIASIIGSTLPPGDFTVDGAGNLLFTSTEPPSLWRSLGRIEATDRSGR